MKQVQSNKRTNEVKQTLTEVTNKQQFDNLVTMLAVQQTKNFEFVNNKVIFNMSGAISLELRSNGTWRLI